MAFYVALFFLFVAIVYIGRKMDTMSDRLHEVCGSILTLTEKHQNDQNQNNQNIKALQELRPRLSEFGCVPILYPQKRCHYRYNIRAPIPNPRINSLARVYL